jgi:hypothetical protein
MTDVASANRQVCSTAMNDRSSRSHCIVFVQVLSDDPNHKQGKLVLVDLAGSERVKKSEVTGAGRVCSVCVCSVCVMCVVSIHHINEVFVLVAIHSIQFTYTYTPILRRGFERGNLHQQVSFGSGRCDQQSATQQITRAIQEQQAHVRVCVCVCMCVCVCVCGGVRYFPLSLCCVCVCTRRFL